MSRGPLDPRLLRHARTSRTGIGMMAVLGAGQAAATLTVAVALARIVTGHDALVLLAAAFVLRACLTRAEQTVAQRTAAAVTDELRRSTLAAALRRGPAWVAGYGSGRLAAVLTGGLDALRPWFAGYLPALILGVALPPLVIAAMAVVDPASALIALLTLPLIPVLGALIGWATQQRARQAWAADARLAGHFLDVVRGLTTLRMYGRAERQTAVVREMTDQHRSATVRVLRLAFLSSTALDLVATLSVGLIAVEAGLRVAGGSLALGPALLVILLAPEAYRPLREMAAKYHASADASAVIADVAEVLASPKQSNASGGAARDSANGLGGDVAGSKTLDGRPSDGKTSTRAAWASGALTRGPSTRAASTGGAWAGGPSTRAAWARGAWAGGAWAGGALGRGILDGAGSHESFAGSGAATIAIPWSGDRSARLRRAVDLTSCPAAACSGASAAGRMPWGDPVYRGFPLVDECWRLRVRNSPLLSKICRGAAGSLTGGNRVGVCPIPRTARISGISGKGVPGLEAAATLSSNPGWGAERSVPSRDLLLVGGVVGPPWVPVELGCARAGASVAPVGAWFGQVGLGGSGGDAGRSPGRGMATSRGSNPAKDSDAVLVPAASLLAADRVGRFGAGGERPSVLATRLRVRHPGATVDALSLAGLAVRDGELVALRGPSGAGKTTALRVLAGLQPADAGRVEISGPGLLYLPQRPTLPHVRTVSDAFPGLDTDQIRAALSTVGLDDEIAPDTSLGEHGAGVSAGQRQRLALAALLRTARHEPTVLLLDEPTAHLDADAESTVIAQLRAAADRGCAVLVVAHRPRLLKAADRIITVTPPTPTTPPPPPLTPPTTSARTSPTTPALASPTPALTPPTSAATPALASPTPAATPALTSPTSAVAPALTSPTSAVAPGLVSPASAAIPISPPGVPALPALASGPPTRGTSGFVRFAGWAARSPATAVGFGAAAWLAGILLTGAAAWLLVRASTRPPVLTLSAAVVLVRGSAVARPLLRYVERLVAHDVAFARLGEWRARVFADLIPRVPGPRLHRRGDLLTRIADDVDARVDGLLRGRLPALAAAATVTVVAVAAVLVLPAMVVPLAAGLLISAVVAPAVAARQATRLETATGRARAELRDAVVETVDGLEELAVLAGDDGAAALAVPDRRSRVLARLEARAARATGTAAALGQLGWGVAVTGTAFVTAHSGLSPEWAAVLLLAIVALGEPVAALPDAAVAQRRAAGAETRLAEIASRPPSPARHRTTRPDDQPATNNGIAMPALDASGTPDRPPTTNNGMAVHGLVASGNLDQPPTTNNDVAAHTLHPNGHPDQPPTTNNDVAAHTLHPNGHPDQPPTTNNDDAAHTLHPNGHPDQPPTTKNDVAVRGLVAGWDPDRPAALRGVDLGLPAGSRVAVLGPSGGGKSTLAAVLAGLLDPWAGTVTGVRRSVLVGDEADHVFASSVRENLRLARPGATDRELHAALARVRLAGWLAQLPAGLDTWLGAGGSTISGGQRRRLATARALLADPDLLILDEPTEGLDEAGAEALMADLLDAASGRTVLLLTHRTEGLDRVDARYELRDGAVTLCRRADTPLAAAR